MHFVDEGHVVDDPGGRLPGTLVRPAAADEAVQALADVTGGTAERHHEGGLPRRHPHRVQDTLPDRVKLSGSPGGDQGFQVLASSRTK
ncbi:hypothetical protein GCM10010446_32550 [Streptomyces enissocaesilis]|uniref:Uncharacterized protein n=1 Tax=Streptomyces enissocaesilis TaxID=332589 RepID=A0ABN3X9M8_9ACTN